MRITRRQLRKIIQETKSGILSEMNPDGTISPDEDDEVADLMADAERIIDVLIETVIENADRIGGGFRAPGIKARAFEMIAAKISRQIRGRY